MVNNMPAMWDIPVRSLGWKDPLEKGMATRSGILAWQSLWTEAWQATVHGIPKNQM